METPLYKTPNYPTYYQESYYSSMQTASNGMGNGHMSGMYQNSSALIPPMSLPVKMMRPQELPKRDLGFQMNPVKNRKKEHK